MADIEVHGAKIADGRIQSLEIRLHGLPPRTIDRDTTVAWMRDGHSMVPVANGRRLPALVLVEAGDELFVRSDTTPTAADAVSLPG